MRLVAGAPSTGREPTWEGLGKPPRAFPRRTIQLGPYQGALPTGLTPMVVLCHGRPTTHQVLTPHQDRRRTEHTFTASASHPLTSHIRPGIQSLHRMPPQSGCDPHRPHVHGHGSGARGWRSPRAHRPLPEHGPGGTREVARTRPARESVTDTAGARGWSC